MFGLSFGELLVLLLVGVVVLGPKELPRYLRRAGQLAGRLRQLAFEMRAKSGIDEVLRSEGIDTDIAEIRRLASFARGELNGVVSAVRSATNGVRLNDVPGSPYPAAAPTVAASTVVPMPAQLPEREAARPVIDRQREYPTLAVDSYGALPETAHVYDGELPASPLATDRLYAQGDDDHHAGETTS